MGQTDHRDIAPTPVPLRYSAGEQGNVRVADLRRAWVRWTILQSVSVGVLAGAIGVAGVVVWSLRAWVWVMLGGCLCLNVALLVAQCVGRGWLLRVATWVCELLASVQTLIVIIAAPVVFCVMWVWILSMRSGIARFVVAMAMTTLAGLLLLAPLAIATAALHAARAYREVLAAFRGSGPPAHHG